MKLNKIVTIFIGVITFSIIDVAIAHHSFSMFDRDRELVLEGTVVRWAFNSPHVALYLRTDDETLYSLEGAAPASLVSRPPAMNGFTFEPGNHVKVVYCPLRDGRPGGAIGFIITDDNIYYRPGDAGCGPDQRWEEWIGAGFMSKAEAMK